MCCVYTYIYIYIYISLSIFLSFCQMAGVASIAWQKAAFPITPSNSLQDQNQNQNSRYVCVCVCLRACVCLCVLVCVCVCSIGQTVTELLPSACHNGSIGFLSEARACSGVHDLQADFQRLSLMQILVRFPLPLVLSQKQAVSGVVFQYVAALESTHSLQITKCNHLLGIYCN